MITHDDVRTIAMSLPGSFEQPSYGGRPSWRTKQRMFTWIREDPEALVVWVGSVDEKEVLLASDPQVFFTIDHYDGYPIVLISLDQVERDEATELITESWRIRAPKKLVKEFDESGG
jgi:hypothetical protein